MGVGTQRFPGEAADAGAVLGREPVHFAQVPVGIVVVAERAGIVDGDLAGHGRPAAGMPPQPLKGAGTAGSGAFLQAGGPVAGLAGGIEETAAVLPGEALDLLEQGLGQPARRQAVAAAVETDDRIEQVGLGAGVSAQAGVVLGEPAVETGQVAFGPETVAKALAMGQGPVLVAFEAADQVVVEGELVDVVGGGQAGGEAEVAGLLELEAGVQRGGVVLAGKGGHVPPGGQAQVEHAGVVHAHAEGAGLEGEFAAVEPAGGMVEARVETGERVIDCGQLRHAVERVEAGQAAVGIVVAGGVVAVDHHQVRLLPTHVHALLADVEIELEAGIAGLAQGLTGVGLLETAVEFGEGEALLVGGLFGLAFEGGQRRAVLRGERGGNRFAGEGLQ